MRGKTLVFCALFVGSLAVQTHIAHAFSMQGVYRSFVRRFVLGLCKVGIESYWENYLASHGYDFVSQQEEARRSGACPISWPSFVRGEVPIAPETVPQRLQERIDALRVGRYQWPTCKPILLVGPAGTGKTQLARYVAQQSQCPFIYSSAAGFMSNKQDSGVETVARLFKRSRIRPELSSWALRARQLWYWLWRRVVPRKKPAIILIDEFDAISKPAGNAVCEGDQELEIERQKTLARLHWEVSHNEYTQGHIQGPLCPPANYSERVVALWYEVKSEIIRVLLGIKIVRAFFGNRVRPALPAEQSLAEHKKNHSFYWEFLCGKRKAEALVIATTNSPANELSSDIRDNFDVITMPPFDQGQRRTILQFHAQGKHFEAPDIIERLSEQSKGYSADKLASILNKAAMLSAMPGGDGIIRAADINKAIARCYKSDRTVIL